MKILPDNLTLFDKAPAERSVYQVLPWRLQDPDGLSHRRLSGSFLGSGTRKYVVFIIED